MAAFTVRTAPGTGISDTASVEFRGSNYFYLINAVEATI